MRKITSADAIFFQPLFRETQQSSYIIEVSGYNVVTDYDGRKPPERVSEARETPSAVGISACDALMMYTALLKKNGAREKLLEKVYFIWNRTNSGVSLAPASCRESFLQRRGTSNNEATHTG